MRRVDLNLFYRRDKNPGGRNRTIWAILISDSLVSQEILFGGTDDHYRTQRRRNCHWSQSGHRQRNSYLSYSSQVPGSGFSAK